MTGYATTVALGDSVSYRVKYADSVTKYATPTMLNDSAASIRSAIPSVTGYVPYTGATGAVNLGANNLSTTATISQAICNIASPTNVTGVLNVNGSIYCIQNSVTAITLTGVAADFEASTNSFYQINIRNASNGNNASGDYVATADNGSNTTHFVDLGINSSGYTQSTWTLNYSDGAYLYSQQDSFVIGTASNAPLQLFTGNTLAANVKVTIDTLGNVFVGTAGGKTGAVALNGKTSGTVTMKGPDAPTSYTWTVPSSIAASTGMVMEVSSISGNTVTMTFTAVGSTPSTVSVYTITETSGNFTVNGSNGNWQQLTHVANGTITLSNISVGQSVNLYVANNGGNTITINPPNYTIVAGNGQGSWPVTNITGAILTISVKAGGTGYAVGDLFAFTSGGGSSATGIVTSVSSGVVTGIQIVNQGSGYSLTGGTAATTSVVTGSGNGALTVNILTLGIIDKYVITNNGTTLGNSSYEMTMKPYNN